MHPDLFKLGPITVHTYGVAMAVSFLVGFWFAAKRAPREHLDPEMVLDSFLWMFLGVMIGARGIYILTDWQEFRAEPLRMLKVWEGGLVFYGGFLGGMVGEYIFVSLRKVSFWQLMDLFTPYAALGYAIHRTLGCMLGNGCCYGKPTNLPWGIMYPMEHITRQAFGAVHVHPTQMYESINGLFIMLVMIAYRRSPRRIGSRTGIFFILYSVLRFLVEFLRGDEIRGFWGPLIGGIQLSTSQWISIGIFIFGIFLLLRKTPMVEPLSKEDAANFLDDLRKSEEAEKPQPAP